MFRRYRRQPGRTSRLIWAAPHLWRFRLLQILTIRGIDHVQDASLRNHIRVRNIGRPDAGGSQRLPVGEGASGAGRSEEHTSELQSLMRISYAVFCLTKKKKANK